MNALHRGTGTRLTADEVASASGGTVADVPTPTDAVPGIAVEERDYPHNPAGPVTTGPAARMFNRK